MVDEMDWKAAMSSEVFRTFVANELKKEAELEARQKAEDANLIREFVAGQIRSEVKAIKEAEEDIEQKYQALQDFDSFEMKVKASPELLNKFRLAKRALISDPKLMDKVDAKFVEGIMMMDLGEEK